MGAGIGFASFLNGAMKGASFASAMQEQQRLQQERADQLQARKAADASLGNYLVAQQGTQQRVAGSLPMANGAETAGPPKPVVENVIDLDKVNQLRMDTLSNISKAYGPKAAMEMNELFRREDERVIGKASKDMLAGLKAGQFDTLPGIYNRTAIGGVMEGISGDKENGYTVKFRGQDPVKMSYSDWEDALLAKNSTVDDLITQEYRNRALALQEKTRADSATHQTKTLDETVRHNKAMEGIYGDNYAARNQNSAEANRIRELGVAARRERADNLYPDALFKVKDPVSGEERLDLPAKTTAKYLHDAFYQRTGNEDLARQMSMDAIDKARLAAQQAASADRDVAKQQGRAPRTYDSFYQELLKGYMAPPAQPAPSAPAPAPQKTSPTIAPAPAPTTPRAVPTQGINPPARPDPLAGIKGDEQARKLRDSMIAERQRYAGRPEAAARIKEIDVLIDRLNRRDY